MEVLLKTEDEINLLRDANHLVGLTFSELGKHIKSGVTTLQLDRIAGDFIRDNGAVPVLQKKACPFGEPLLANIGIHIFNDLSFGAYVGRSVLCEGDIVNVDCSLRLNDFYGMSTYSFCVGNVSERNHYCLDVSKEALTYGIEHTFAGKHLGDLGKAINSICQLHGFHLYEKSLGFGIGMNLQESPKISCGSICGNRLLLKESMCLHVKPQLFFNKITVYDKLKGLYGKYTCLHPISLFSHTIVVRKEKSDILSSFSEI